MNGSITSLSSSRRSTRSNRNGEIPHDDNTGSPSHHSNARSPTSPNLKRNFGKTNLQRFLSSKTSTSALSVRVNFLADSVTSEIPVLSSSLSLNIPVLPGVPAPKIIRANGKPIYCEFPNVIDPFAVSSASTQDVFANTECLHVVDSLDSDNPQLRRTSSLPGVGTDRLFRPVRDSYYDDEDNEWRHTMDDLVEENEDSLQSRSSGRLLLAKAARNIPTQPEPVENLHCLYDDLESMSEETKRGIQRKYRKNLIILALSFMMFFASYLSLRNLQSSINDIDNLGLYSLCSVYGTLIVGSFLSKYIVERLRPKKTLVMSCIAFMIYASSNFYPSLFTIVPASSLMGFSIANTWTAQATYLSNSASGYADYSGKSLKHALSNFNGIFYAFFHLGSIGGNAISSVILTYADPVDTSVNVQSNQSVYSSIYENTTNFSSAPLLLGSNSSDSSDCPCGAKFDISTAEPSARSVTLITRCILVATFLGIMALGTLTLLCCLDPLEGEMMRSDASLGKQILAVFKFFLNIKVILLLPLMIYSILQSTFMFGEFSKSFVTCATGVYMVGYAMMCIAGSACVSSFISGKLVQVTGRIPLIYFAILIHQTLLIIFLNWEPIESQRRYFFVVTAFWGFADGFVQNQLISLLGSVFEFNRVSAFAALKVVQASAAFSNFLTSGYMLTGHKIHIMQAVGLATALGYGGMEYMEYLNSKKADEVSVEEPVTV